MNNPLVFSGLDITKGQYWLLSLATVSITPAYSSGKQGKQSVKNWINLGFWETAHLSLP